MPASEKHRSIGLRLKIFFWSFGVTLATVLVAYAYLETGLRSSHKEHLLGEFRVRAELIAELAISESRPPMNGNAIPLQQLVKSLHAKAHGRVTIIARDGTVLADSNVSLRDVEELENHSTRPEVVAALNGTIGSSTRESATTGREMYYVAVPANGVGFAAVRVATPVAIVDQLSNAYSDTLSVGILVALCVALLVSTVAANRAARPAQLLMATAQQLASGSLDVRAPKLGADEFGALGESLNRLAESQQRTLLALRAEKDRLSSVLRSMQEGVLLFDNEYRTLLANDALRNMLLIGGSPVGKDVRQLLADDAFNQLLTRGHEDASTQSEIEVRRLGGRRFLVNVAKVKGNSEAVLAVIVDLTQVRRLESVRRDFVANASHELRTPIAAVHSAAETLLGPAAEQPNIREKFLGMIIRNTDRLKMLVDDLMELSKVESSSFQVEIQEIKLEPSIRACLDALTPAARKRSTDLVCRIPVKLTAQLDERGIDHVITNLVDNAIKYCPDGSTIEVGAEAAPNGRTLIWVKDDGQGIAEEHLDRLFERFYRVDPGRSRHLGGTGLGLAIVKHWVEAMGGQITVKSQLEKGTVFQLTMQAQPSTSEPPQA